VGRRAAVPGREIAIITSEPGKSRRLPRPNWARNNGVVTHNVGVPGACLRPCAVITPVSSNNSIVAWESDTPLTASIYGRVIG
jgi:hypothetical protein